ncbi:carbohydrate-binding module family 20 protein [Laetiporus sulphureus 93-53]|uniref:Glucoamylase n=1 Tax=Laetiporus sulphureus 93-53 TaxID=1314785 RepID=A0A165FNC3_9APHY|nr:carbohydrate-binding module family 20 protein [Laetiporus sulphureus 93-53]KZT09226.1 carbohydrate-binding module family 20 protein [Laetiporus sulphureus 93-53]
MRLSLTSFLALTGGVLAQTGSIGSYITTESPIAEAGVLANIGASGSLSDGAYSGIVIASPSTVNPDYLYTWVRDSSLTFKVLIDQYTSGENSSDSLRTLIDEFVTAESILQQTSNPSGTVSTGGLGEPKFNIDETAFTGAWGRPQRDGPALRATAIIAYANWLLDNDNATYVTDTLWPMIELDLGYVAEYWNDTTFDLWEEIDSSSYFTSAVQHRALREGITLATRLDETSDVSDYETQADGILCFMQSFWNPDDLYMTANTGGGRSGKDANTVLASIHTFDAEAVCDDLTFQPCSDKALSNLKVYVDSFRDLYTINDDIAASEAVATGRYPEDVYYGGNPWYLCTFAVAEQLYDALIVWEAAGEINVTDTSLAFFQQFESTLTTGTYDSSTDTYSDLMTFVKDFADGFVLMNAQYTASNGSLSEQYLESDGAQTSAYDLTWSFASALTAFARRNGTTYGSWGAANANSSCLSSGTVAVTFEVVYDTVYGENLYITGSVSELADWSVDNALEMSNPDYPTWSITVYLPANTALQYKYLTKYNGDVTWEDDPNNEITTPSNGSVTQSDSWH